LPVVSDEATAAVRRPQRLLLFDQLVYVVQQRRVIHGDVILPDQQ
jgi:hypothetical protein